MNPSEIEQIVKLKRQEIITDFFDKNGIECIWLGVLRMTLNNIHFTWHHDFSGIELDLHRTTQDQKMVKKLERYFLGQRINDFDNLVKLIKSSGTIFAHRNISSINRRTGVLDEKLKRVKDF